MSRSVDPLSHLFGAVVFLIGGVVMMMLNALYPPAAFGPIKVDFGFLLAVGLAARGGWSLRKWLRSGDASDRR